MTIQQKTSYLLLLLIIFLTFGSSNLFGKYVSQYVNVDCSGENPGLSELEKQNIWYSYVKLTEGNWIHYSFSDSSWNNQSNVNSNSKQLSKELNTYLINHGIAAERITLKYSPYASLVVYKEAGKNIAANHVSLEDKDTQYFTVDNSTGGSCLTKAGNRIDFPPNAFKCSLNAQVHVEVQEMLTKRDFVRSGYTSTANNRLLESRGMYNIKASANDKEVNLRPGKSAEIKFSKDNFPGVSEASTFNTFYGKEKKGIVDWTISNYENIKANNSASDLPPMSKRQMGKSRITRKVTYTETTYVQLCKKIHLVNTKISKNMKSCKLDKKSYNSIVREHGSLNRLSKGKLVDIVSYSDYLSVSRKEPNAVLLGLNQKQKEDFDKSATEEKNAKIAAAEERQKKYEAQQAQIAEAKQDRLLAEAVNFPVAMKISKLGNINCDRFNGGTEKTNVIVQLDDYDYDEIKVYAVFNDIKSVMNGYYREEHKGMIKFDKIPMGRKVTYIAATFKGDEVKLAYVSKEIKEDDLIVLSLNTYSRENYNRILDDLIP